MENFKTSENFAVYFEFQNEKKGEKSYKFSTDACAHNIDEIKHSKYCQVDFRKIQIEKVFTSYNFR